jgi:protoporphyrinogen oxidase
MWERVAELLRRKGTPIEMGAEVVRINHEGGRVTSVEARTADGGRQTWQADHFISSLPIRELVASFSPRPPAAVLEAAESLKYRDFLTVDLVVKRGEVCPDNWIYVHDPEVRVARISNFKRFSRDMVPDDQTTGLGLEYFCFEGDGIWESSDEELVALGTREVEQLGLASADEVAGGKVHRQAKTYPVYDDEYLNHLRVIREYVEAELPNLQFIGRNGMHRYNNQDHSMMTGILAAQNIALGETFDLWKVNGDAEYLEEVREDDDSGRQTPSRVKDDASVPTAGSAR